MSLHALGRKLARFAGRSGPPDDVFDDRSVEERHHERRSIAAVEAGVTRYLATGLAAVVRPFPDGRRQTVQLVLPGDELGFLIETGSGLTVQFLARSTSVSGRPVVQAASRSTVLADAVLACRAERLHFLVEQVSRLGRQSALARTANLFAELHYRYAAIDQVSRGNTIPFPMLQEELGELLGLSPVHVNRTLTKMRNAEHIELGRGEVKLNLSAILAVADFRPPARPSRLPFEHDKQAGPAADAPEVAAIARASLPNAASTG